MVTTIKSASVKVMLSYNYCHFEISMTLENDEVLTNTEIDNARKECMRLCDKAIEQYKIAKQVEQKKTEISDEHDMDRFSYDRIQKKPKTEWTSEEKAKVKAFDEFEEYNYQDDYEL
ncbi:hypothetical protein LCGC14_0501010 [marine sediment metagenome]|uniref:Uncharacterized protein n=1 Tax=marine sediment metagenome TaxID=412755 RepID=A0A0F9UQS2_9ZZZZ|nr:hypothetical protein [Pricia sp.]